MARFTAPPVLAFSLALFAVAQLRCSAAAAQEGEPLGLFERMFAGSERVGAPQNGAAPAAGERIAQLIFAHALHVEISEVAELGETTRGSGGFGSTGTGRERQSD